MILLKFYSLQLSGPLKLLVTREHSISYTFWILLLGRLGPLQFFFSLLEFNVVG